MNGWQCKVVWLWSLAEEFLIGNWKWCCFNLIAICSTLQHHNEHLKLQEFWFCVDQSQGKSWQTSRSQHNKLISVAANGLVFLCLIGFFLETW